MSCVIERQDRETLESMSCVIERQGDIGVYVLCYRQDRETLESMSCVIDRTGRHWSLCPVL